MANKQIDDRLKNLLSKIQIQLESLDEQSMPLNSEKDGSIDNNPAKTPDTKVEDSVCPFLKTAWDKNIWYGYPNEENNCYKLEKAQSVPLTDQEQICFTSQFCECPIYTARPVELKKGLNIFQRISTRILHRWSIMRVPVKSSIIQSFMNQGSSNCCKEIVMRCVSGCAYNCKS